MGTKTLAMFFLSQTLLSCPPLACDFRKAVLVLAAEGNDFSTLKNLLVQLLPQLQ